MAGNTRRHAVQRQMEHVTQFGLRHYTEQFRGDRPVGDIEFHVKRLKGVLNETCRLEEAMSLPNGVVLTLWTDQLPEPGLRAYRTSLHPEGGLEFKLLDSGFDKPCPICGRVHTLEDFHW